MFTRDVRAEDTTFLRQAAAFDRGAIAAMTNMDEVRAVDFGRNVCGDLDEGEAHEWVVTNGIGGFASGTVAGSLTRRYHGLLIAALKPPVERTLLVTKIDETVDYRATTIDFATNRWASGAIAPEGYRTIERFRLEGTTPVWTFAVDDALLEKRVWMEHGRNLTYVSYRVVRASAPLTLELRAFVNYRDFHAITHAGTWAMRTDATSSAVCVTAFDGAMPIWIVADRGFVRAEHTWSRDYALAREAERGLGAVEDHLLAATISVDLDGANPSVTLALAGEATIPAIDPLAFERRAVRDRALLAAARPILAPDGAAPAWIEQLVLAADQFVVARPLAGDPAATSMIAGYHWFGDWGRDTMIALPGIAIATGRPRVAETILRTFARFVDGGMLPNYFPDAGSLPEYNSVDAALWFVEAVRAYDAATNDAALARDLFPTMVAIVDAYERGTRYRIAVDPADGLLFAGDPGVQVTWMDAKVGDHVITPRIGKTIEVNALWYNALRVLEAFAARVNDATSADRFAALAARTATGFERFWNAALDRCYDVIDGPSGDDASLRPNALIAASLSYTPLSLERQRTIVAACGTRLVTSYGLRSLDPSDAAYCGHYGGDTSARDGAYHQGTVWGWLVGPWVAALLRCSVSRAEARTYLEPFRHEMQRYGLGTLAEIADGDAPFAPNGAIAQAWTVANVLDAWRLTASSSPPSATGT